MELLDDWWKSPLADDHYGYLRKRELLLPVFHMQSPQIGARRYLIDWLAVICDKHDICSTARHLMVALLDHFMDKFRVADHQLKLAGLAALLIAGKYEDVENRLPKISELNKYVHPNLPYTRQEFMEMELVLLQYHQWSVSLPTAAHFFDYFLIDNVTADDLDFGWGFHSRDKAKEYLEKYGNYFIEISLQDASYRRSLPSLVCAAAIASARTCLHLRNPWPLVLQKRTGYEWANVSLLVDKMLTTFKQDQQSSKEVYSTAAQSPNSITLSLENTPNNHGLTNSRNGTPLMSVAKSTGIVMATGVAKVTSVEEKVTVCKIIQSVSGC